MILAAATMMVTLRLCYATDYAHTFAFSATCRDALPFYLCLPRMLRAHMPPPRYAAERHALRLMRVRQRLMFSARMAVIVCAPCS